MAESDPPSSPAPDKADPEEKEDQNVEETDSSAKEDAEQSKANGKDAAKEDAPEGAPEDEDEKPKELIKVIPDEEFFASLSQEEREWYDELGPSQEDVDDKVIHCTSCGKQVTNESANTAQRHPLLGVITCRQCKMFYNDGEWTKDEEGSFEYCRWCGNGGDLLLCDKCPEAFCKRCVQRNLGRKYLSNVNSAEEWSCFVCDPKTIYKFRAEYHAVSKMLKAQKSRAKSKGAQGTPKKSAGVSKKIEAELLKAPSNFIDKSLGNCFKAFSLQTKALEDEQKRWLRTKRNMDVDNAVNMTKNLRKLFAATKHNMEVLDEMILENFHETFPDEQFSKVRIPKVTSQFNLVPQELKRKLTMTSTSKASPSKSSTPTPKKKQILAKKKRPASSQSNEIVLNGSPVTQSLSVGEDFDPTSMLSVELDEGEPQAKKPKMGPKSAMAKKMGPKSKTSGQAVAKKPLSRPGEYKVSTNMFAKKKKRPRPANPDSDSDVEVIDL